MHTTTDPRVSGRAAGAPDGSRGPEPPQEGRFVRMIRIRPTFAQLAGGLATPLATIGPVGEVFPAFGSRVRAITAPGGASVGRVVNVPVPSDETVKLPTGTGAVSPAITHV